MTMQDNKQDKKTAKSALRRYALALCMGVSIGASMLAPLPALAQTQTIKFWTLPQGDLLAYQKLYEDLTGKFRSQTGITVQVQMLNPSTMFNTWLTVAQGGAAPDCADMYWLHSFAGIGGSKYGPMPISEYRDQWPTLETDFYGAALKDVFWKNDFYGIPWRVDIRPMIYRADALKEAGFKEPPKTWNEIIEMGKALTKRDAKGNVTRWGFTPGISNPAQVLYPYYWQAGGKFLSDDGKTATIDNEAMRTALKFMQDLVHTYKITSPEIFEKSADPLTDFVSGKVAMNGSALSAWAVQLDRDYPELEGKWALAANPKGPVGQDSFSGGGYWGVLRGTKNVKECIDWIKFLSSPDNMQHISEVTGMASPRKAVMTSPAWSNRPWKKAVAETINYGHTSQQPSPVWAALASPEPGAILYDLIYSTVIGRADIDQAVKKAQQRMQTELDRAKGG